MPVSRRLPRNACWLTACALALAGCSRQDTECLARLGRKLLDRAQQTTEEVRGQVRAGLQTAHGDEGAPDRVRQRLRWDKVLADTAIEVHGAGPEVELRGRVRTALQRLRALDLAEKTLGVEKVSDSLQLADP